MIETQPMLAAAPSEFGRRGIAILALGAVYFGAARLGLLLASVHGNVSPVWPATGVAIGALLLGGLRLWPGVALGAFLANVLTTVSPLVALGICVGNTLEAVAGAWIFIRCADACRRSEMEHLAGPAAFALASVVAPLISATCGVLNLLAGGEIQRAMAGTLWLTWWVGDALGAVTVAPLLVAMRDTLRERRPWAAWDALLAMIMAATVMAVCIMVFFRPVNGSFVFMVFPVLLLAVARFGSIGVKLAAFGISALSIGAAFYGSGPFLAGTLNEDLLHLQLFLTSVATAALLLPVIQAIGRLIPLSLLLVAGWALAGWLLSSLHQDRLRNDAARFDLLVAHATHQLQQGLAGYDDGRRREEGQFAANPAGSGEWRAHVQALFGGMFDPRPGEISLRLFAGRSTAREHLLYASPGSALGEAAFERVTEVPFGGRVFSAGWSRGPEFVSSGESPALWAATSSALVSFLMVGLVVSLQAVSRRAQATVARRTEELVASEERLRLLIENVQDYAIFVLNPDGRVASWNRGAERIKGYAAGDVVGRNFSIFYPMPEVAAGKPGRGLAEASAHGRLEEEGWLIRKDGTRFWANVIVTVLRNRENVPVGFVVITRDITERKELEENLARARDDALQASRFKSEFLATMSHEIRTPMNGVIGMAGLLMQTPLSEEQREMGRVIENSADSLLTIINDILDFSKVEAGKLRLESTEFLLRDVIEETLALLAPRAHEKRLELVCDIDVALDRPLTGDPGRIRQVLTNLVSNAITFTSHGEVVLSARLQRLTAERTTFRLTVSDTGSGIPAETRAHLFEPYVQASGASIRRLGSTGLGLAICRRLVDLMGGTLDFESTPGHGSTFWCDLELPSGALNPGDRPMSALPFGLRVLVVDDNPTNRRILLAQLARFGLQAEAVQDGPAALAWLRAAAAAGTPCQLVLLDWDMPGMSGLQLAVKIRVDQTFARLPLVMLSSAGPLDDPAVAADVGFAVFLTKPVREAQLHRCLARVLDAPGTVAEVPKEGADAVVAPPPGGGLSLLLAEDSIANQMVARMLLEQMGHVVTVANNGKEALALLSQESFDAVIMDCQMPVLDGYEVTRRIRSGREPGVVPWIPVIALTVHTLPEDRQKCLNAGMDDYISKPARMHSVQEAFLRCGLIKDSAGFRSPQIRALNYYGNGRPSREPKRRPANVPGASTMRPGAGLDPSIPPILVVDDDPNDIALMRQGLEDARIGNAIITLTSGEAAIDFLTSTYLEPVLLRPAYPRVIFLDIVMRGMNGFQVLTWIRKQEELKKIKVVMVSSIATPREIELSREFGADQHVVKYPSPELLAQIVATGRKELPRF